MDQPTTTTTSPHTRAGLTTPTQPTITLLTRNAAADNLTDQDYREIYDELRSRCPLRQFAETIHSGVSFAWWSKYERSEPRLNHDRRNELRAAVGLPTLPPEVSAALASVSPNAAVWRYGHGTADQVLLVAEASHDQPVTVRLSGDLQIVSDDPPRHSPVTAVTPSRRRATTKAIRLYPETWERLSMLRREANMSWDEFAAWIADLCGG